MKTSESQSTVRRAARLTGTLLPLAACLMTGIIAQAHITYSGRDFESYSGLTNGTRTITNQTVSGNFGWADAADGILGDSHKGRAFRFRLLNPALVTLTVSANPTTNLLVLTPAFSLYSGLAAIAPFASQNPTNNGATSADHDFGDASVVWRTWWVQQNLNPSATDPGPTDGSWNALGEVSLPLGALGTSH